MGKFENLTGQKFGRLTVLEMAGRKQEPSGKKRIQWKCRCDCGKIIITSGERLKKGTVKSCGCLASELTSERRRCKLSGKRFGKWTVLDFDEKSGKWNLMCDCGNRGQSTSYMLKSGRSHQCKECSYKEIGNKNATHHMAGTRIFKIWVTMKQRCSNPNNQKFKDYGGRGISVCEDWKNSFESFYDWSMKSGYSEVLTIDRIDVNGNYCPENCRWATISQQANNKRNSKKITYNGETHTVMEWSKIVGLNHETLNDRIDRGWNIKRALFEKPFTGKNQFFIP